MTLSDAVKLALDTLEDAKGNINPERGYCDELEADIQRAIDALISIEVSE